MPDECVGMSAAQQKFGKTPLLMDDEMEAQYKMVYNRAMAGNAASAEINLVGFLIRHSALLHDLATEGSNGNTHCNVGTFLA
jgi:hypothetical protein